MPPTLADRLQHVLEAIDDCQNILNERDQEAFARDRATRLAVERALEIISEASRHIPKELKERDATIAWRNIADLGNRLPHVYHRVDPNVLWDIVRRDLPALRLFLYQVIRDEQAK